MTTQTDLAQALREVTDDLEAELNARYAKVLCDAGGSAGDGAGVV